MFFRTCKNLDADPGEYSILPCLAAFDTVDDGILTEKSCWPLWIILGVVLFSFTAVFPFLLLILDPLLRFPRGSVFGPISLVLYTLSDIGLMNNSRVDMWKKMKDGYFALYVYF